MSMPTRSRGVIGRSGGGRKSVTTGIGFGFAFSWTLAVTCEAGGHLPQPLSPTVYLLNVASITKPV